MFQTYVLTYIREDKGLTAAQERGLEALEKRKCGFCSYLGRERAG
jgi:hypothetical protein